MKYDDVNTIIANLTPKAMYDVDAINIHGNQKLAQAIQAYNTRAAKKIEVKNGTAMIEGLKVRSYAAGKDYDKHKDQMRAIRDQYLKDIKSNPKASASGYKRVAINNFKQCDWYQD